MSYGFPLHLSHGETPFSRMTIAISLNGIGEYARSVALEDDTIVTIHDNLGSDRNVKGSGRGRLMVLRWKAPPREEVEKHGFFTPREVETGLK